MLTVLSGSTTTTATTASWSSGPSTSSGAQPWSTKLWCLLTLLRSVKKYADENIPLLPSDKNALLSLEAPAADQGTKTAVVVQMTLHKSTYATMCLREILKVSFRPTRWA